MKIIFSQLLFCKIKSETSFPKFRMMRLVETRGVEPLSKKSAPRVSPSAVPVRVSAEGRTGTSRLRPFR